jgi:CheY-like chemotaxis protein
MSSGDKQLILVVDDEDQLRKLKRTLLERAGYAVLLAASGSEALAISRGFAGDIHLLVSDIEMQGMSGLDLARRMTAERPSMRVLLNSGNPGYAEKTDFPFLAKPFLPHQLQNAVAQVLQNGVISEAVPRRYSEEQASVSPISAVPVEIIRRHKKLSWRLPQTATYWAAAALIVLAVVPLGLYQRRSRLSLTNTLTLHATRGLVNPVVTSGRALILNLDTSGLPQQDSYQIETLTEAGQVIAASRARAHDSTVSVACPGLGPGVYFVRLYDPSRNLLREFALEVRGKQVATP